MVKTNICFSKGFLIVLTLLLCLQTQAQDKAPVETYNYSKIASHPRLLLSEADEKVMIKAIADNPGFKKIDTYINKISDQIILEEPLVYEMKGKRLLHISRKALTRLYYLSFSYRVTKDKKYLDRAEKELNAVCNFETWNPSHFLDVGEMAMGVAIAYDWLYTDLQESTKQNVRKALIEKAFKPSYEPKQSWFLESTSNWNSVCNAGLVFGALAIMEDERKEAVPIIERALKSNLLPLTVFAPDGNYPEGPGYWNYGTTFQVMLIAALESALGSDNGLSKAPGFMKSAEYMLFSGGPSGYAFNYYDCGENQTAIATMFWFADKTKNASLISKEIEMINNDNYTKVEAGDIERILPNALVFGRNINVSKIELPKQKIYVGHGLTPVAIVRTEWKGSNGKYLGVKGGSATDGHSHMDQGTFVYDIGSNRWAMDFGLQSYGTLESKGVDLWNMKQDSQRWELFKYNNLNHNTLTINNQKHNILGRANIIETFEKGKELGAKIDLTGVLNFNNELKSATRKAVLVDESYLKIEDIIEVNANPVDLRWNMVTRAAAVIVDKNTIKLSMKGKILFLKVTSDTPITLAIRPSEDPSKYKSEFGNYNYGDYNQLNKGTVMVGFDSKIQANATAKFTVTLIEGKTELVLKNNTIVLDGPDPSTGSEGETNYSDSSPIGITDTGDLFAMETPDWNIYGKIDLQKAQGKSFKFQIDAKRITPTGIVEAGIDRSANGQLGIRGGDGNGIDKNEGYVLGLDLSDFDSSTTVLLTKIGFTTLDASETCVMINRKSQDKMLIYTGKDVQLNRDVKITKDQIVKLVDVSSLGISLVGGKNHQDILSLFNTSEGGNFRVSGFEFEIK